MGMAAHAYIEQRRSLSPTGYPHYELVARVYISQPDVLTLASAIGALAQITGRTPPGLTSSIRGEWEEDPERISDIFEISATQLLAERDRNGAVGTSFPTKLEAALAAMQALGDNARLVFWMSM